ncbi:MAG: hypothetical protein LQ352_002662 [Teloschistes flavicans]|nr:MAG: hypothetical protein LQ352_002662 [Teloschistes flavicans]
MTQADTHAMMSLGVKERTIGHYEVHIVKSTSSTSCGEQVTSTPSEFNSTSNKSFAAPGDDATDRYDEADEVEATDSLKLPAVEIMTHPEPEPEMTESDESAGPEFVSDQVNGEEVAGVEKWRQDVGTVDATDDPQARIDALLAANVQVEGKTDEDVKDKNPQRERAKAGLVPGKKVYCCLYKHEMPDGATLKAIGYHALPPWYVVAHPEKARERGYCIPGGTFNRFGGGRNDSSMGTPFGSFRAAPQAQHPSLYPPQHSGFGSRANGSLNPPPRHSWASTQGSLYSNAEPQSASPRIQELSEQQYQQWQAANHQNQPRELQIMRRPYRSPGYNTFAFQPPHLVTSSDPTPEPPQTKPAAPMWEPRPSKLAHRPAPREGEKPRLSQSSDESNIQKTELASVHVKRETTAAPPLGPSSTVRGQVSGSSSQRTKAPYDKVSSSADSQQASPAVKLYSGRSPAINTIFAPLEPSPPSPKAAVSTRQERPASSSSDLFASAPKVPSAPAHRRFVPHGEEGRATRTAGPKLSEVGKRILKHDIQDAVAASPDKEHFSRERAARGQSGSSELLLDLESTAGD